MATNIKVCNFRLKLSLVLASVILNSRNFHWFSFDSSKSSDDRMTSSMYSSSARLNGTHGAIRTKQSMLMKAYINSSVDPCEDFYEYACGNWEIINPIPSDKWQHSTIDLLHHNLENELRELLSQPIETDSNGPIGATDKTKLFFKNCMDVEAHNSRGTEPLLRFIKDLGGWPVLEENWSSADFDWLQLTIKTSFIGIIIAYKIDKNPTVPTEYAILLKQTTLGMSNRDNYLKIENSKNLEAYRHLIEKVLRLLKVDEQKARNVSAEIVAFEVRLANATLPPEATKTELFVQPTIEQIQNIYPYIDWQKYFSAAQQREIGMNQTLQMQLGVKYYKNLYQVLNGTENHTLANYMIWRCVLFTILSLDDRFRGAWGDYNAAVTGQVQPNPIWRTCVNQINFYMGMATSAMFVRKYFDESSKNETISIIDSLKEAFDENLLELDWIDAETKAYASKKANAMKIAAGYPDYILSDEDLNDIFKDIRIVEGMHYENFLSIVNSTRRRHQALLYKPFNKNRWILPPTAVNALYDNGANRIIILAGLLQPPVFHKHFPQSLNYGCIGMLMGHEIIHGFDDIGRNFGLDGDLLTWWTFDAIFNFEERADCFLRQYGSFSKFDRRFKSIATMSENLADNGGLRLAYKAYSNWKQRNSNPELATEETFANVALNADQLFFLSFAQMFCAAVRPEAMLQSQGYKAHSPEKYRVLGALVNFEKFSEVYGCHVESPMNPTTKCRLW